MKNVKDELFLKHKLNYHEVNFFDSSLKHKFVSEDVNLTYVPGHISCKWNCNQNKKCKECKSIAILFGL